MEKRYLVEIVSSQASHYRVTARDARSAEKVASERWRRGEPGDVLGVDSARLVEARATEVRSDSRQDQEVMLRFVQEREKILGRLAGRLAEPSLNDAISAGQAASDLGWFLETSPGKTTADTVRAAEALEKLCADRKVVCFERERVRSGERGPIRLYCTPDYLEKLSSSFSGLEATI